jgi:MoxR-like ATPase
VLVGSSPRGSLALMLLARARAAMSGRDYVIPEDVKEVAVPALAHRMTLRPEMWLKRVDPASIVTDVLASTPAPASGAVPNYGAPGPRSTPAHGRSEDWEYAEPGEAADPYRYTARG